MMQTMLVFYRVHAFIWREESILEEIAPTELHEKMQDPSFLEEAQLIDVREPEEVYDLIPCDCMF